MLGEPLFSKNNPLPHPPQATVIEIQRWCHSRPESQPCDWDVRRDSTKRWGRCIEIISLVQGDRWTSRGSSGTRGAEASSPNPSIGEKYSLKTDRKIARPSKARMHIGASPLLMISHAGYSKPDFYRCAVTKPSARNHEMGAASAHVQTTPRRSA